MAKVKGSGTMPNRPIYSRISYLYQAATYLASHCEAKGSSTMAQSPESPGNAKSETKSTANDKQTSPVSHANYTLSRRFITDLRSASLKSQIRLSPTMKHTICKYCDSLLIEGTTSSSTVENKSKNGRKPWADILVVKCHTCGGVKRFPVQAPRQKRRPVREKESQEIHEENQEIHDVMEQG